MVESLADILAECVSSSSWTDTPSTPVVWVTPQQVTHRAFVWHFLNAVEGSNVVKGVNTGRQTAMETEDLILDQCSKWEIIEQVGKVFPDIGVTVFAQTLVVESIHLGDLARFVIASEDGNALGVTDFESDEKGDSLDGEVSTVDIVAYKIREYDSRESDIGMTYP